MLAHWNSSETTLFFKGNRMERIVEKELWQYLKQTDKPIVLYGMGNGADKIIKVLEEKEIRYNGVFASDGFVRDKEFHGFKISSYQELKEKFGEMIVLLCFGSSRPEVIANVKRIASEQELYAPEVPVIGGGLFTESYFKNNFEEFKEVYDRLADDKSRQTFIDIVNYKLSGKIEYLFDCQTQPYEPYESFFKLHDNEVFLDLGAYTGDTVADFMNRVNDWKGIIAVEPDKKTFKKLVRNTEKVKKIELLNKCISSYCGVGGFAMNSGRNSVISENGTQTEFVTVDSILNGRDVSYIKMDVEGEEVGAIKGGSESIKRCKPKMLISCYHRTDDLLSIPKAVLSIRNDYKMYMRHFSSILAWDTNYYFV